MNRGDSEIADRWFLSPAERGNADSDVDRDHDGGRAYTFGNDVRVLVDGANYFGRLYEVVTGLQAGDQLLFTDWRGDADERLDGPGSAIGMVLAAAASRGVHVRGLVWRSHVDRMHFSEKENRDLAEFVNAAGGEVLLDERVRRAGSHHQKIVVVHGRDASDIAFIGGIDLCHGRHDDHTHRGDAQAVQLDRRYGEHPAWHDVQLEVRGPAVADIDRTFRERWDDPTPLDHGVPWRMLLRRVAREPRHSQPLPPPAAVAQPAGQHAVQVLRTYPAKRPAYPFARTGERSIARAYLKAFGRARSLIYIEDQYLWSRAAADALATALRRSADLRVVAIVPAHPDRDGRLTGPPYRIGQQRAIEHVLAAGGDRVAVYDLEGEHGRPVYVHAKVCVVDDVWVAVGSDNLNRRSWTHDSEASCAVIDDARDDRAPTDPTGNGDGARRLARDTRLRLWHEHSGVDPGELVDPVRAFDVLAQRADALDAWHAGGCRGPRPPGRLSRHQLEPVRGTSRVWSPLLYRALIDPDGRPRRLRRDHRF